MKKLLLLIIILVLAVSGCENCGYKPYNAYVFLGGSNISEDLAAGFEDCIKMYDETAIVIHHGHDNARLRDWVHLYYDSYKVQHTLSEDIGVVDSILNDEYGVQAVFWFQGEADTLDTGDYNYYEQRLGFIRKEIRNGLPGLAQFCTIQTYIDDLNGTNEVHQEKIRDAQQLIGQYCFDSKHYGRKDEQLLTAEEAYRLGWVVADKYRKLKGM